MTSERQKEAGRENIKKAQEKWESMSPRARAKAQPEGRERSKPGSTGEGDYYHVMVRPKSDFTSFRTQDVGREGHSQRVAGRRSSGSWATQKWLISKEDAHVDGDTLVADSDEANEILNQLQSKPKHVKGDVFEARPRKNVPEKDKPTKAQKKARQENIKKAQEAWKEKHSS